MVDEETTKMYKQWVELVTKQAIEGPKEVKKLKRRIKALEMRLEAERIPPEILAAREMAREDTISRAKDVLPTDHPEKKWPLDYAESSKGLYPSGNQLGRRYLLSQDFGFKSWNFEKPDEHTPTPAPETMAADANRLGRHQILDHFIIPEEAFFIIQGFKYRPLDGEPELQSLSHCWAGIMIPPMNISFTNARMVGGYYVVNLEVPPVLSPRMMIELTAFFTHLNAHKYQLGIFGEVIGRRRYLFPDPQSLLTRR